MVGAGPHTAHQWPTDTQYSWGNLGRLPLTSALSEGRSSGQLHHRGSESPHSGTGRRQTGPLGEGARNPDPNLHSASAAALWVPSPCSLLELSERTSFLLCSESPTAADSKGEACPGGCSEGPFQKPAAHRSFEDTSLKEKGWGHGGEGESSPELTLGFRQGSSDCPGKASTFRAENAGGGAGTGSIALGLKTKKELS